MPSQTRRASQRRQQISQPPSGDDALTRRYRRWFTIAAIILPLVLFTALTYRWASRGDYPSHYIFAFTLLTKHILVAPHLLYHVIFLLYWSVVNPAVYLPAGTLTMEQLQHGAILAGTLATLTFHIVLSVTLFYLLFDVIAKRLAPFKAAILALLLTGGLLLVSAISFTIPLDGMHYYGFIVQTPAHNPTVIAAKPFGLLLCVYAVYLLQTENTFRLRQVIVALLITILSMLAKPSYAICILPGLMLFTLPVMFRKEWRKVAMLLLGIFLPAILCLSWQYFFTYSDSSKAGIILAPFAVVSLHSSFVGLKFLLSLLFPAAAYLIFFPLARRDLALNFSWLVFLVSTLYLYFLAESGSRFSDGNWGWGATTSLFIVFVFTVIFLIKNHDAIWKQPKLRLTYQVCWLFFLLHVINGIQWQYYLMHSNVYN